MVEAIKESNENPRNNDVAETLKALSHFYFCKFQTEHSMFACLQPPISLQILWKHQQDRSINAFGNRSHLEK